MTTPASTTPDLKPSLVRTGSPFIVGLIGSWLTRQGLDINDDLLSAALVAVWGYGYYVVARFLEVFSSDKWGYVLGVRKAPVYAAVPGVTTVQDTEGTRRVVTDDAGRGLLGTFGFVLALVAAVCIVLHLLGVFLTSLLGAIIVLLIGLALLVADDRGVRR